MISYTFNSLAGDWSLLTLNFEHQSVADQASEVSVEVLAIAQFVSVFPIGGRAYSIPQAAV